jgi:hypothetical protein
MMLARGMQAFQEGESLSIPENNFLKMEFSWRRGAFRREERRLRYLGFDFWLKFSLEVIVGLCGEWIKHIELPKASGCFRSGKLGISPPSELS